MNMGGMNANPAQPACKISMLWNWYTIDSCFIARSWHVRTTGMFAGSCIGVFLMVVAAQWLARFGRELDIAFAKQNAKNRALMGANSSESSDDELKGQPKIQQDGSNANPLLFAISHGWLFTKQSGDICSTPMQHLIRCLMFTAQWGLSYLIMLLFMYYNGYIIISCILGALFGKLLFGYTEAIHKDDTEDRKCCR
ncbi:hypothetical protein DFJ63DRAFT_320664 [Scheffersomyces coipomensis]|uniref:uncharacterized protein n=1 Tax=Scheffersomyces coipomensis TaxID=1788519 RepID=UPI00315DA320